MAGRCEDFSSTHPVLFFKGIKINQARQRKVKSLKKKKKKCLPQRVDLHLLDNLIIFRKKGGLNFAIVRVSGRWQRRRCELWRLIFLVWELFPWLLHKKSVKSLEYLQNTLCVSSNLLYYLQKIAIYHQDLIICETESRMNLPEEIDLPLCTWHLQWQLDRKSVVDLLSESSPYDSVASPVAPHEYAPMTVPCGWTSTQQQGHPVHIRVKRADLKGLYLISVPKYYGLEQSIWLYFSLTDDQVTNCYSVDFQ